MEKKEVKLEKEQMLNETVSLACLPHLSRKIVCICSLDLIVALVHKHSAQNTSGDYMQRLE